MSFDRGQYSMMGLPSRQVAQRGLHSHSRLKIRRTRADSKEETAEERLKRLKQELEQREKATSETKPITTESKTAEQAKPEEEKAKLQEFDDADSLPSSGSSSEDEEEDPKPKAQGSKADQALAKELERIRREKALKEQAVPTAKVSLGVNPLLDKTSVQRRWDDDVIFKNQAKSEPDRSEKRLVNDIVHSDTHKKFMKKFIH